MGQSPRMLRRHQTFLRCSAFSHTALPVIREFSRMQEGIAANKGVRGFPCHFPSTHTDCCGSAQQGSLFFVQVFQTDEATSSASPAYISESDSSANFPQSTTTLAKIPSNIGPCPRRWCALIPSVPTAMRRKVAVSGSKCFVDSGTNPMPSADSRPAYAGQQAGHATFGRSETPMPGKSDEVCFQLKRGLLWLQARR